MSRKYVNKWFKTFPKRYWGSLDVKGLQSYQQSKVEAWQKILPFGQNRTRRVRPGFESRSVFIILNIQGTVTLEPFDIQRPTVPLWKGLEPLVNIVSAQEICSILKTDFALLKWPHLHRVYLIRVKHLLSKTVHLFRGNLSYIPLPACQRRRSPWEKYRIISRAPKPVMLPWLRNLKTSPLLIKHASSNCCSFSSFIHIAVRKLKNIQK